MSNNVSLNIYLTSPPTNLAFSESFDERNKENGESNNPDDTSA